MEIKRLNADELKDRSYIKICENKAHRGPVPESVTKAQKAKGFSAAANKIRVTADFTIIPISKDDKEEMTKASYQAKSYQICVTDGTDAVETAKQAFAYMQSWDSIFSAQGTDEYLAKLADAVKAQASAYAELGINPSSRKRPNLTSDQRAVYNAAVGPYGFDYYEYHLAYKQVGSLRFIRSQTYRSLEPLDIQAIVNRVNKAAEQYLNTVTIEAKSAN